MNTEHPQTLKAGVTFNAFFFENASFRFSATNDLTYGAKLCRKNNITICDTHNDIVFYILPRFYEDYQNLSENSNERKVIKTTSNFLANFAKYR